MYNKNFVQHHNIVVTLFNISHAPAIFKSFVFETKTLADL